MSTHNNLSSGKRGVSVRSDCYFEIELTTKGGINIESKSKVEALYGKQNREFILKLCANAKIKNANIFFEDSGALPFVIAARFDAAVSEGFQNHNVFQMPHSADYSSTTSKNRLRRSRLYLPGNEPKFFLNAGLHKPDGIILDLEDSVSPQEKDQARFLIKNALRTVNFYGCERMVRINQLPMGIKDLQFVIPENVHVILLPKCESDEQVKLVGDEIFEIKKLHRLSNPIYIMPIIESAKGVENAYKIAAASPYVCALTIGLEDYTADIGTARTLAGAESFYARSVVINAAKSAGIQAIDSVFSDVSDMDALTNSVLEAKSLGFEGKGCIHPRQIEPIHNAFAPVQEEIQKAAKIVIAFDEAQKRGSSVISIGSKMIDPPVVKRALRVIDLALLNNLIDDNWRENYENAVK